MAKAIRVRDGQSDPRGDARGRRALRADQAPGSDYPNQINNVLCFPGRLRSARAPTPDKITEEMKLAAARGIAEVVTDDDLSGLCDPIGLQPRRGANRRPGRGRGGEGAGLALLGRDRNFRDGRSSADGASPEDDAAASSDVKTG